MRSLRLHPAEPQSDAPRSGPLPLGRHLIDAGVITTADLMFALDMQKYVDSPLGEILIAEGLAQRDDVMRALARQHRAPLIDLQFAPPSLALHSEMHADLCLKYSAVPWLTLNDTLWIATSRPHLFAGLARQVSALGLNVLPVIADEGDVKDQITRLYGKELAQRAATRVPLEASCRGWDITSTRRKAWA